MTIQKWYERVRSGKFYYKPVHGRALPNPDSRDVISREFSTTAKRCPVDSPRNPGRQGHAHHVVEFGAFYQLVEVAGADRWWIQHTRSGKDSSHKLLTATTSKGPQPLHNTINYEDLALTLLEVLHMELDSHHCVYYRQSLLQGKRGTSERKLSLAGKTKGPFLGCFLIVTGSMPTGICI